MSLKVRISPYTVLECHDSLSVPRYEGTTETSLNAPASDTARQKENKQSVARPKDTLRQSEQKNSTKKLNLGGVLLLLLIGFVISLIMIDAAQQGIIDRAWLDMILRILPDKSQLEMIIRDIIAKGAQ